MRFVSAVSPGAGDSTARGRSASIPSRRSDHSGALRAAIAAPTCAARRTTGAPIVQTASKIRSPSRHRDREAEGEEADRGLAGLPAVEGVARA